MESEKKQTKRKYEKKNMSVAATVSTTLAVGLNINSFVTDV